MRWPAAEARALPGHLPGCNDYVSCARDPVWCIRGPRSSPNPAREHELGEIANGPVRSWRSRCESLFIRRAKRGAVFPAVVEAPGAVAEHLVVQPDLQAGLVRGSEERRSMGRRPQPRGRPRDPVASGRLSQVRHAFASAPRDVVGRRLRTSESQGLDTNPTRRENVRGELPHISTTDGTPSQSVSRIVRNRPGMSVTHDAPDDHGANPASHGR
jgi:hypothetical protein